MACTKYYGCNSSSMKIDALYNILDKKHILENVPLKEHTTFKTGGNAQVMVLPQNNSQLIDVLYLIKDTPHYVIGRGSNLLVSDEGLEGVVIKLGENFADIGVDGNLISAKSGTYLSKLASSALNANLGGAEFLSGIPGTLGGAVCMNAGAYDSEICDFIKTVDVLTKDLQIVTLSNLQMGFDYRSSNVFENGYIILGATLELFNKDKELIKQRTAELNNMRKEKQPLNMASAGSTFKRPLGNYAGALIEKCDLKGFSIGDAQVSQKHCGFVVNTANASSKDIYKLINYIIKTVHKKTGITLQCEVKFLGNFD